MSAGWSDEPTVLVKRWIEDLGNPIMVLVLLTEQKPYEAVGTTLRRLAFLLLPLSLLFVRYFPELGRSYHNDGAPMYTGIGHQKNDLGLMCLVTGIYFFWKLLQPRDRSAAAEPFGVFDLTLVGMLAYLLYMSNSQTALTCLVVSVLIMLATRLPGIARAPSRVIPAGLVAALVLVALESSFEIKNQILTLLGRDPSLTNRTELWDVVLSQQTNSVVGAGFMSFWTGDRMQNIWDALGGGINQAHNGYLEQVLNLGYVGVAFIFGLMAIALYPRGGPSMRIQRRRCCGCVSSPAPPSTTTRRRPSTASTTCGCCSCWRPSTSPASR